MKTQSVSVQNFENLVKQMVNEALEDNEQAIKFHRMIYEEWYFKKLSDLKGTTREENEMKPLTVDEQQNISKTVTHRRSRWYKYKRLKRRSSTDINPTRNRNVGNYSENSRVRSLSLKNEKKSSSIYDEDNSTANYKIHFVSNDPIKRFDPIDDYESVRDDTKVIEIWNKSLKRPNQSRNETDHVVYENRSPEKKQNKEKLSFEAWKNRKTIAYRQILKKKEYEKQQQLLANLANMERKRIVQQEQERKRQLRKHQRNQRLSNKYLAAIGRPNVFANSNLDALRKRKDVKLDKEETTALTTATRRPNTVNNSRKSKPPTSIQLMEGAVFDGWLNRLNWVLHDKYLRERRHLVRSFYCQPLYYGGATLCAR